MENRIVHGYIIMKQKNYGRKAIIKMERKKESGQHGMKADRKTMKVHLLIIKRMENGQAGMKTEKQKI